MEIATQTVIDVDETVPELPFKDVFFRIYRDIRFSKIKTPYKVRRKKRRAFGVGHDGMIELHDLNLFAHTI